MKHQVSSICLLSLCILVFRAKTQQATLKKQDSSFGKTQQATLNKQDLR
jgi:hypothetical protein